MDTFSDDGFDELNANALQELESQAIQFTQAQKKYELSQEELDCDFEDDDLDDAVVHDELRGGGKSVLPPEKPAELPSRILPQQASRPQHNGWGPVPIPASHFRPSQSPRYSQIRPPPPLPRPAPRYQPSQVQQRPLEPPNRDQELLLAQIQELQSRLNTKDGEIQIVRKRLEKDRQDHDRELQTIRKQTAEQLAKNERLVEAAKVAERTAATELEFTKRDLKDELDRAKRREKDGGTPKRNAAAKTWGVSDGFEDVEMAGSPSKGNRGKPPGAVASVVSEPPARLTRTPTKGKRKRPAVDSPVMALETTEDVLMLDDVGTAEEIAQSYSIGASLKSLPFDFLRVILNHSTAYGRPLTFEYLASFALPSTPGQSLASLLFHRLAVIGDPSDPMRIPIEFCEAIIALLHKCHEEGCLEPITELISLVSFTLQLNTVAIVPHIAQSLLAIGQDIAFEVAIPRFHNHDLSKYNHANGKNWAAHISTTGILSVLYLTALGCAISSPVGGALSPPIVDYWSSVHLEYVLINLSHNQLLPDFLAMLKLLCTSVFEETVGSITHKNKTAEEVASPVIDRVSIYLIETPKWDISKEELQGVRSTILRTLAAFAKSKVGMSQLKGHDSAVPRLAIFLYHLIDDLYDGETKTMYAFSPTIHPEEAGEAQAQATPTDELRTLISHTMLLLHTIITDKSDETPVNLQSKLAKITGGTQKYLLSLARLNFADSEEDLLGVNEETADLAHELLELAVTEEDGAELGVFFGG
ncbi:uncharacterized protein BCR38DRAFT_334381 [Pseudomassariella vexata]|uniref:DNA repair protein Rad26 n=1 Tax=Pseudomassariella vexata TaxID=1141098 RepID=A0A1Y2EG91_9PEZI|nr:uncharacterized protein BCR38DRAFT_334381 [Pseudomassariella vexata]ORY70437.1 hypothetical protein BCR38DRAFT_334381 [Pseudomassariella vexata]